MTAMERRERRTEEGGQALRERMNGGDGGVLRGDCGLSVAAGREKRRTVYGTQSDENGGRHRRMEKEEEQRLDRECH